MSTGLFEAIETAVFKKLEALSPDLTYHSSGHTRDVVRQSERIAHDEAVSDPRQLFVLKLAALYHDTGFLETYANHEETSCAIFLRECASFGLNAVETSLVTELIMATKLPQDPKTLLQKIICDADLDYLGRSDFDLIAEKLKQEFFVYGLVETEEEWESLQLKFLTTHTYHTASSRRKREPIKQQNLHSLIR